MSFTPVKNVRIKSLTEGAVVQLRLGKAAVKSVDDVIISAKLVSQTDEGEKTLVVFQETDVDGKVSEITVSRYPRAPWMLDDDKYVSLIGVDEATFTIQRAASPIQTDAIDEAVKLIEVNSEDVFGYELLVALLTKIRDGKRVNTEIKDLATRFASKLVDELSSLADDPVVEASAS